MDGKNKVAATLAITAMLGFLFIFAVLGFGKVPPENKDFFNMGFIALIGFVGTAFGYYLGSSIGSAQKNNILAQIAGPAQEPSPDKGSGEGLGSAGYVRLLLLFLLAAFACLIFMIGGCATTGQSTTGGSETTPLQTAGKSLLAVKSAIVTAATATDALCKADKIAADKCAQAQVAYEKSKITYDVAVNSFLAMSQGGDPTAFRAALIRLQDLAADPILTGGAQ